MKTRATGVWAPLDPAQSYRIVTNSFLREGGDFQDGLKNAAAGPDANTKDNVALAQEVVLRYLSSQAASLKVVSYEDILRCGRDFPSPIRVSKGMPEWPAQQSDCDVIYSSGLESVDPTCPTSAATCQAVKSGQSVIARVFGYSVPNGTDCANERCSGLGTCVRTVCRCSAPGLPRDAAFRGQVMLRGNDCSEPMAELSLYSSIVVVVYVLGAAVLALSLGCMAANWYLRHSTGFRHRSRLMLFGVPCGVLVLIAGVFAAVQVTCRSTFPWCISWGMGDGAARCCCFCCCSCCY